MVLDFFSNATRFFVLGFVARPCFAIFAPVFLFHAMKRILILSLLLLLCVSSCTKSIEYQTLGSRWPLFKQIYALKDTAADSAYSMFSQVADTINENALRRESDFLFAEYQILKAELQYKNFKPILNKSLVNEACDFYDSIFANQRMSRKNVELTFQHARASYYKAAVLQGNEETQVESFSEYLKSLWIMDGLCYKRRVFAPAKPSIEHVHFTGLIYDRLAWFLYNRDAWDAAQNALELSNECFGYEGDLEGLASNFSLMGDMMLAQEDRNGAVGYYQKADSLYAMLQREDVLFDFMDLSHQSLAKTVEGERQQAKRMLYKGLETIDVPWMERNFHLGLGYIYYDEQANDSSLYHYEHSYPLLPRQTAKAYSRIILLANQLGDSVKAARYGQLLAEYQISQVQQGQQKMHMLTLYESHKDESKDVRNRDILFFILLIIVVLAVIIVVDSIFIQMRKNRHKRDLNRHEEIQATLEDEIELTRKEARRKEEEVKALEARIEKMVANPDFHQLPFDKKLATLYEMPISKRVRTVLDANVKAFSSYPELVLSENQMSMLINAVDAVFPKFSLRIIEMYPRLKRSDVIYCCLYIMGISEVQAAALMGKTYQAVWTRSLKLHEIFDNKSNLQLVLLDILRIW